ncbi:MAG: hypothetical protein KGJ88_05115 [Verrucomicrobiota bacterium]|nr:hypothetical protein [Verrucomicrobiota bacterium]
MEGILQSFYEAIPENEPLLGRGAFAWAPSAFLQEQFLQVEFGSANPAVDFGKGYITLHPRAAEECHDPKLGIFHHNPVHEIHLRANEAYAALRYKRRLVVVISVGTELMGLGERAMRRVKQRFPDCYLCAPIYTLSSEAEPHRYPASFIERVKAYGLPMTFYLAAERGQREACVRFDRIQAIAKDFLRPHKLRLTMGCQKVFDDWLNHYLYGALPAGSEIGDYQRLLAEQGIN